MAIIHTAHTATAIIRMASTGRIGPTATILGGHTTGTTDTVIIAITVIITIGTKLIQGIKPTELALALVKPALFLLTDPAFDVAADAQGRLGSARLGNPVDAILDERRLCCGLFTSGERLLQKH